MTARSRPGAALALSRRAGRAADHDALDLARADLLELHRGRLVLFGSSSAMRRPWRGAAATISWSL